MTRAFRLAAIGILVLPTASAVTAQSADLPPVFALLEGEWVGTGTLLGRSAAFTMRWTRESDSATRLDFTNGFRGPDGAVTPVLTAVAVYTVSASGEVSAHWEDSRPQEIRIVAEATDSTLTSEWSAEAESGRTKYRVMADGTVQVRDWVHAAEGSRPFGEARYRRSGR